jgi:hypothetical protein
MIFIFLLLQHHWQFEDSGIYQDEKMIEMVNVAAADSHFHFEYENNQKKTNDEQLKKTMNQEIKGV